MGVAEIEAVVEAVFYEMFDCGECEVFDEATAEWLAVPFEQPRQRQLNAVAQDIFAELASQLA